MSGFLNDGRSDASQAQDAPSAQTVQRAKAELRSSVNAARDARTAADRAALDRVRTQVASQLCGTTPGPIALYLSAGNEPDTLALAQILHEAGRQLLVPWLDAERPAEPNWARYTTQLVAGPHGIPQPVSEPLGAAALGEATVILLPGLAGGLDGTRLGTGGCWYDRALADAAPGAKRWLLLNESEVLASVPSEPHDQLVQLLVTEMGSHETDYAGQ